jgi:hypothetical protein
MTDSDDALFAQMRSLYETPVVQDFYHHVAGIAGFDLPPSVKAIFDVHRRHFFDEPQPEFMQNYGEAPNKHRQKRYMESVFGSSQSATAAVLYHRENLLRMERDILSFIDRDTLATIVGKSAFGGGNTQKLDFEYHGFVFAYRRALDYLARGIAALLQQDFNSFRRLPDFLNEHVRHEWVTNLITIHAGYASKLDTFLGNRTDRSTRDKIAHYLSVPAGCLNVTADGIFFAGGGENLDASRTLASVTNEYDQLLRQVIGEVLPAIASGFPKPNA